MVKLISAEHRENALTAHLVSRAKGANFAMYLVNMQASGSASGPAPGIERYTQVLPGFDDSNRQHVSSSPMTMFPWIVANLQQVLYCKAAEICLCVNADSSLSWMGLYS